MASLDVQASEILAAWLSAEDVSRTHGIEQCGRPGCGGQVVFGDCCLLCARQPGRDVSEPPPRPWRKEHKRR